ncbi:MAG: DUF6398 domain-containing protein [Candidatus Bathyarchaeota archaeon]|nr:DUF6398 domain-containing protein [Candidatus Termiticorpusculum sp.]
MMLVRSDVALFYKLWCALVWSVNQKHKIVPVFKKPVYGERICEEPFIVIRSKLWENPHWIDDFLCEKDSDVLSEDECEILKGWRENFIKGQFMVVKHLEKYSVFMTCEGSTKLYGVCGISNPVREMVSHDVPCLVDAVLLPFKGKIIFDSVIINHSISFGKSMRDSIKDEYEKIKETVGIIEVIGVPPTPVKQQHATKKSAPLQVVSLSAVDKGSNVPKSMTAKYVEVAELIENFCDEKLNEEYKEICLRALAKLCRKRPSPLMSGKVRTWACGIIYAIGSSNFIFDKSQPINMSADEIAEWFSLSKSTAGSKAAEVNKLLDLSYFNAEFQLKGLVAENPAIWYLTVNGLIVDIRAMPRELQEEAFRKGLIPYIPADKNDDDV